MNFGLQLGFPAKAKGNAHGSVYKAKAAKIRTKLSVCSFKFEALSKRRT